MNRLLRNPPSLAMAPPVRLAAALTAMLAAAACNCSGVRLVNSSPQIAVLPNPVALGNTIVNQAVDTKVQVFNHGHGTLIFSKAPFVVMNEPVPQPVFAVVNLFQTNCDGSSRNGDTTDITSGGCAELDLRFLTTADGTYDGVLRFVTNDPKNSTYDVPITTIAATSHVHVCYENAGQETCNVDGQPLQVNSSDLVALGSSGDLSFEIKSIGTRTATIDTMVMNGDADFTSMPAASAFHTLNIAGGGDWPFTIVFTPLAGGQRGTTVTFTTEDPLNRALSVQIAGEGDGPGLCWCVGSATMRCTPTTTANFTQVPVGGTGDMFVELSSCGTQPLTFTNVALTAGAPEFSVQNTPASGTVFAPSDPVMTLPMTFSPPTNQAYSGQLAIGTTNQPGGFITLVGTGAQSGCHLSAASNTINFGTVATGVLSKVTYAVSNTGTEECTFPKAPVITSGQPPFSLVSFPLSPLPPGGTVQFTVGYDPPGASGTDTGQMAIYYAGEETGSPTQTLDVTLKGTETATPVCVLTAEPGANSLFGRTLNFGDVLLNTTLTLPITFRNVGSKNCTLGNAQLVGGITLPGMPSDLSAFAIQQQPTPLTVSPGQTATAVIAFTPTAETSYGSPLPTGGALPGFGDAVQIQTSDTVDFDGTGCGGFGLGGPAGCVAWSLSGQGATSALVVLPSDIDFGTITLGCESLTKTVTLYNVGQANIHITGFTIDPSTPAVFNLIAPPASTSSPITLVPGNSLTIKVQYSPSQLGAETATLYIDSDANNANGSSSNPYVSVSLEGAGTNDAGQTDTFTQPEHPTVDVLWVIDQDSDSMADKIAAVSANAQAFIQTAEQEGTDFHLGVASIYVSGNLKTNCGENSPNCTSGSSYNGVTIEPGVLYHANGAAAWVSSADANPTMEFSQNVQIGISSTVTGAEFGLEAMYLTLSSPNIVGANAGFLRDSARLIVITISDDDDAGSPKPTNFYASFLESLKPGEPQNVTFDMVGGDMPDGCTNGVDGDAPIRYDQVVQPTGGKLYSICTGNYSQIAADLSLGSFGGLTVFTLSRPCDPSTLTVTVNGTPVQMGTDYTFDSTRNAIVFGTAPPAGATIVANYNTVCTP